MKTFICAICSKTKPVNETGTGGTCYAVNKSGRKVCYKCCANIDKDDMKKNKKIILYLVKEKNGKGHTVANWPGTLKIPVSYIQKGKHNIAGTRYDIWFEFNGYMWYGVKYGENTQLCHCKQTKQEVNLPMII